MTDIVPKNEEVKVVIPPKDEKKKNKFNEDDAKHVLDKMISVELVPEMVKAVNNSLGGVHKESFNGQFSIAEGVYAEIKLYSTETALSDQIMKSDHWAGIHLLKDVPAVEGAPNFRRVPGTMLFGVGQPSYDGLLKVVDIIHSNEKSRQYEGRLATNDISSTTDRPGEVPEDPKEQPNRSVAQYFNDVYFMPFNKIFWINLREEPVTYIDGTPYAPRDRETLNINLDHLLGIEGMDLETMEQRMKADIINRAFNQANNEFEYVSQDQEMNNNILTVQLSPRSVRTPVEIMDQIKEKAPIPIDYCRIPITDECAPEEKDFDELVYVLKDLRLVSSSPNEETNAAAVFNCQMGRGRTTTGLVCAYLIMYTHSSRLETNRRTLPRRNSANIFPFKKLGEVNYRNGEYQVILKLVSCIDNGPIIKQQVDMAIDACSQIQNLREAIVECRDIWKSGDQDASKMLQRGLNYLERYWWLIVFNSYLAEQAPIGYKKTFTSWMKDRWGLRRLLRKLVLE